MLHWVDEQVKNTKKKGTQMNFWRGELFIKYLEKISEKVSDHQKLFEMKEIWR